MSKSGQYYLNLRHVASDPHVGLEQPVARHKGVPVLEVQLDSFPAARFRRRSMRALGFVGLHDTQGTTNVCTWQGAVV